MFKEWLKADIEKATRKSDRVVISDPTRFLTFAVKDFADYTVLTLNSPAEEMNARLQAQTAHSGKKVLFLCFFPAKDIAQLKEFSGIGGFINMDSPTRYIRDRLYESLHRNVALPESKLLLSAMLSDGKSLTWWRGIADETINPFDFKEHLHQLILNPEQYQAGNDERIFSVLRDETFKAIGSPSLPVDAATLLRDLSNAIFKGLIENRLNPSLSDIYYRWANTTDLLPRLRELASYWKLPSNTSPTTANPDHPFEALDRKGLIEIGQRLRDNTSIVDITEAIRLRVSSPKASSLKPLWLSDLLTLLDFDGSEMYLHGGTLKKITTCYIKHFASLDTAMRHLYAQWLAEPELLRPLQEIYESHLKVLLDSWFTLVQPNYSPTQLGLIEAALTASRKAAVLVCDGLRLEIAESIARRLQGSSEICRNAEYAKLPSVTENGMSALFGLDTVITTTSPRFNKLRQSVKGVEIIHFVNLGNSVTAKKLVVMYGDIDNVGEEKGLAGLKDINNYESELTEAVKRLHRMGYDDVFLTADHGFVITGILDEASKVAAPDGTEVKERFFMTDEYISDARFIRREDKFPGATYQYYSKTDRPFRTRGPYGYAHGGFTPQECLIPMYQISVKNRHSGIEVSIANSDALKAVTGQYFNVVLNGNEASIGQRIKVILYTNGAQETSTILKIADNGEASCEFELTAESMSVVVQDTQSSRQLDCATVRKSFSRDLDDLFS